MSNTCQHCSCEPDHPVFTDWQKAVNADLEELNRRTLYLNEKVGGEYPLPEFEIAMIADAGDFNNAGNQTRIVSEVLRRRRDLTLFLGDMFYNGAANAHRDIEKFTPLIDDGTYGILGNHEYDENVVAIHDNYFHRNPGNGRYFDIKIPKYGWHLIFLNSGATSAQLNAGTATEVDGISTTSTQAKWMRTVVSESPYKSFLVFNHVAPVSSVLGKFHPAYDWDFEAMFTQGKRLRGYFHGHGHNAGHIKYKNINYFDCSGTAVDGIRTASPTPNGQDSARISALYTNRDTSAMVVTRISLTPSDASVSYTDTNQTIRYSTFI
jgi:hypothetical protein